MIITIAINDLLIILQMFSSVSEICNFLDSEGKEAEKRDFKWFFFISVISTTEVTLRFIKTLTYYEIGSKPVIITLLHPTYFWHVSVATKVFVGKSKGILSYIGLKETSLK